MVEKPLCADLDEALALRRKVLSAKRDVVLTHTYSGYPMVREMRARVAAGEIGAVRFVEAEYYAGGLATLVEHEADTEQRWRLKPERSGPSLVLGDIGTHGHHLVRFVTSAALDDPLSRCDGPSAGTAGARFRPGSFSSRQRRARPPRRLQCGGRDVEPHPAQGSWREGLPGMDASPSRRAHSAALNGNGASSRRRTPIQRCRQSRHAAVPAWPSRGIAGSCRQSLLPASLIEC